MLNRMLHRVALVLVAIGATLAATLAAPAGRPGEAPPGFTSAKAAVNGSNMHYLRGGHGPALILVHGFPEDWTEYQAVMPRLAQRFTVVAVDLPGIGRSAPPQGGYEAANLAAQIHGLADALHLEKPYVVGHDLGGIVTYAYVRRFPGALRGALILDVPMPGIDGWDKAISGTWHIGFIQAPGGLAEKVVPGRQAAMLGWFLDIGKFTRLERKYYFRIYRAPQLHAAFEIYRAFPGDAEWNASQMAPNSVPLVIAFGQKSPFGALLPTFLDGYRAKGMSHIEGAQIPGADHYVLADNPDAVADLIEKHAAAGTP
ncbi:alpha/beta hydrolase [Mesorhizobium sp. M0293]|uniref:alpha/beta fold hydrolase n=1 Tax=unclassified Mesorhizobium TaxID=325217 RepID=UPI0033399CE5